MPPVGRDDPARRPAGQNSSVDRRNSENRREGQAPPLRGGGETSRNRGRAATEGRPYDVFSVPFGFGVTQARFRGCGGHRIAQGRNCPVGAGLLTRPPFVDHDARRARRLKGRSTQRWPKNSENRREGQAPPLRDDGKCPATGDGRPQRAAPTAFLTAPFGSGGTGAVPWLRWPSHRSGP